MKENKKIREFIDYLEQEDTHNFYFRLGDSPYKIIDNDVKLDVVGELHYYEQGESGYIEFVYNKLNDCVEQMMMFYAYSEMDDGVNDLRRDINQSLEEDGFPFPCKIYMCKMKEYQKNEYVVDIRNVKINQIKK